MTFLTIFIPTTFLTLGTSCSIFYLFCNDNNQMNEEDELFYEDLCRVDNEEGNNAE
jgi:hypothetical protein